MCAQRTTINQNKELGVEIEDFLSALFREMMTCASFREIFVENLINTPDFFIRELFNEIDDKKQGFINPRNLSTFLEKNSPEPILNSDLRIFFKAIPSKTPELLTYSEFLTTFISPFGGNQKINLQIQTTKECLSPGKMGKTLKGLEKSNESLNFNTFSKNEWSPLSSPGKFGKKSKGGVKTANSPENILKKKEFSNNFEFAKTPTKLNNTQIDLKLKYEAQTPSIAGQYKKQMEKLLNGGKVTEDQTYLKYLQYRYKGLNKRIYSQSQQLEPIEPCNDVVENIYNKLKEENLQKIEEKEKRKIEISKEEEQKENIKEEINDKLKPEKKVDFSEIKGKRASIETKLFEKMKIKESLTLSEEEEMTARKGNNIVSANVIKQDKSGEISSLPSRIKSQTQSLKQSPFIKGSDDNLSTDSVDPLILDGLLRKLESFSNKLKVNKIK